MQPNCIKGVGDAAWYSIHEGHNECTIDLHASRPRYSTEEIISGICHMPFRAVYYPIFFIACSELSL